MPLFRPHVFSHGPRRGFALLITIVLVAFLVLILVGLATFTRVETQVADNSQHLAQARQNALFALNVALGQLQQAAGPDQRVTARADILDTDASTPAADGVAQPFWTGVWETGPAALDTGGNQRATSTGETAGMSRSAKIAAAQTRATWLVSSLPTVSAPDPTLSTNLTVSAESVSGVSAQSLDQSGVTTAAANAAPTGVVLAKNLSARDTSAPVDETTNPAYVVAAPLVPLEIEQSQIPGLGSDTGKVAIGKFAYWIADEGVKAKINLSNPDFGSSPTDPQGFVKNQQQTLIAQTMPTHLGLLGPDNTTDLRGQPEFDKVLGARSLSFLSGVDADSLASDKFKAFEPDITTHSYGVLADVRNGGLKTDLSSAFEDPAQYRAFLDSQRVASDSDRGDAKLFSLRGLATNRSNQTPEYFFGVRWQQLYNYHSLYKDLIPANGFNSTASPFRGILDYDTTPDTTTPRLSMQTFQYRSNNNTDTVTTPGEYYLPRILAQSVVLSIASEVVPTPAGRDAPSDGNAYYRLRIYAEPRIVIYNPYNVALQNIQNLELVFGSNLFASLSCEVDAGATKIITSTSSNGDGKPLYGRTGGTFTWRTARASSRCDLTLAPGEIKVLGLSSDNFRSDRAIVSYIDDGGNLHALTHDAGGRLWTYVPNNVNAPNAGNTAIGGVGDGLAASGDWVGELNPTAPIVVRWKPNVFTTNNGSISVALAPGNNTWPQTGSTAATGRFFYTNPNVDTSAAQVANLGAVGNMENNPIKFASLVGRSKGIQQARSIDRSTGFEPLPVFASADGNINPLALTYDTASLDVEAQVATSFTSSNTLQVDGSAPNLFSFWGANSAGRNASDRKGLILADVPRQPALSLGQFMHMPVRASLAAQGTVEVEVSTNPMVVGGSLANPFLARTSTHGSVDYNTNPHKTFFMDDNFLMNEALFDRYFLSTLPPATPDASYRRALPHLVAGGDQEVTDATIRQQTARLPNGRMQFYSKNGEAPQMSDAARANYLPDYRKAAANLVIDGAFNVNSTSVQAWTSFLASLSGNTLRYLDATSTPASLRDMNLGGSDRVAFTRFASPAIADDQDKNANSLFNGVKSLTPDQVRDLAEQIVAQVKTRGPFLSMADFLNRRLENTNLGLKGALQSAIDATTINADNLPSVGQAVNDAPVVAGLRLKGPGAGNTLFPSHTPNNTAYGVPGWLMQQDLVQALAPVATVRSDTFTVRTYGESINPVTGAVQTKAWAEAVVQRVPDFVDQSDPALASLGDATPLSSVNPDNQKFGRRFKVVAFRWLSPNDL